MPLGACSFLLDSLVCKGFQGMVMFFFFTSDCTDTYQYFALLVMALSSYVHNPTFYDACVCALLETLGWILMSLLRFIIYIFVPNVESEHRTMPSKVSGTAWNRYRCGGYLCVLSPHSSRFMCTATISWQVRCIQLTSAPCDLPFSVQASCCLTKSFWVGL